MALTGIVAVGNESVNAPTPPLMVAFWVTPLEFVDDGFASGRINRTGAAHRPAQSHASGARSDAFS